jgi:hypothetical protein
MNGVRQQFIQSSAREATASRLDTLLRDPDLRYDSALVEFPAELPDAAKFQVTLIDVPHRVGFGRIDDQPTLSSLISSGGTPPIHMPLRLEAAILSRMRSPVTSRSNWAKESNTFSVSLPIEVVVLNCWVTATKDTPRASNISTILAKSASERVSRSTL